MRIVSLLSHSCDLLPYQVAAFSRFMPGVPLMVLQGPHGGNPTTSGGTVRLTSEGAAQLGIEAIEAPADLAGLIFPQRLRTLFTLAREWAPGDLLIVHGDLFPIRALAADDLFAGKPAAGRTHGGGYPALTWLALRDGVPVPAFNAPVDPSAFSGFGARVDPGHAELHWEICDPGFLHTDKLSSSTWPAFAGQFPAKVSALASMLAGLGIVPVPWDGCESLIGLTDDAPRLGAPMSIPDDFDPEAERRRLRAGGCCGPPPAP